MFQLEIFRLPQLAKPSRVRQSWSGAPRWLQMRRGYTVYKLRALTMRCSRRLLAQTAELHTLGRFGAFNACAHSYYQRHGDALSSGTASNWSCIRIL